MAKINEEQTVGIPESITIGGVTYSVKDTPELQSFIQAVSKVEKTKLYSQFEALRTEISNLKGVQVETSPATGALNIEELLSKLEGKFVTREDLKQNLSDVVKEVVQPVLDATQRNMQNELDAYRQKLITENAGTCIPELVKGNSREELDASLAESIRLRAAYPSPVAVPGAQGPVKDPLLAAQAQQMNNGGTPQNTPTPGVATTPAAPAPQAPQAPMPAVPHRPSPDAGSTTAGVKTMSMEEFAGKRNALLAELQRTYQQ